MREGDWKLLLMEDGSHPQLYDLAKDPNETRNLAREQPKLVERLSKGLLAWRKSVPAPKLADLNERGNIKAPPDASP
jgi:uncharacterized sulfatase